jgi:hypothetical protein
MIGVMRLALGGENMRDVKGSCGPHLILGTILQLNPWLRNAGSSLDASVTHSNSLRDEHFQVRLNVKLLCVGRAVHNPQMTAELLVRAETWRHLQ